MAFCCSVCTCCLVCTCCSVCIFACWHSLLVGIVACWHLSNIILVTLVEVKRNRRYPVLSSYFLCHGPKDGAAIRARINPRTHIITHIPTSSVCLWVHYFPFFFLSLTCLLRLCGGHAFCTSGLLGSGSGSGTFGSRSRNGGGYVVLQLGRSWTCKGDERDRSR